MNITFNDIVAFIKKSLNSNLKIVAYNLVTSKEIWITDLSLDKTITINLFNNNLCIGTDLGDFEIKDLSSKEVYEYNILFEDCVEYNINSGIKYFNNFFKETKNTPDIDSLDDEED